MLFYHSAADPPAVVGTAVVVREGYPDHTAWQKTNHHFDPKSTIDKPIWYMVDIKLEEIFPASLPLDFLREQKALAKMELLRRGSRLSIQPVTKPEFDTILKLAQSAQARKEVRMSASDHPLDWIDDELSALESQDLLRRQFTHVGPAGATIEIHGRPCVNFGSNDYLGLAADPRVTAAARRASSTRGGAARRVRCWRDVV